MGRFKLHIGGCRDATGAPLISKSKVREIADRPADAAEQVAGVIVGDGYSRVGRGVDSVPNTRIQIQPSAFRPVTTGTSRGPPTPPRDASDSIRIHRRRYCGGYHEPAINLGGPGRCANHLTGALTGNRVRPMLAAFFVVDQRSPPTVTSSLLCLPAP